MQKNEQELARKVMAKAKELNTATFKAAEAGLSVQTIVVDEKAIALNRYENEWPRVNVRVYRPPENKGANS